METLLLKAEKLYKKHRAKMFRLNKAFAKAIHDEQKIKISVKQDKALLELSKYMLIYLGRKMEQAGRDLANSAKKMHDTPGDVEDVINALKKATKEIPYNNHLEKADLHKKISALTVSICFDHIKGAFYEICALLPWTEDDEDDDQDDEDEPEPVIPTLPAFHI